MTVWNTLLKIPLGSTLSYSDLAKKCGHPTAVRAVATAVGRNPIAIFIPCHRVLPKDGRLGNYRWGVEKKRALLEWENIRIPVR
ncbi:MAG: methylated-DNA--[protein]-cysteine S-methyltransferase [Luteolibacter sp.]